LREQLLSCYVNFSISKELSEWLQELGEPAVGTLSEKIARVHNHADSLVPASESFPRQTIFYLSQYEADILAEICQELGIDQEGSRETLFKRIYREVGAREGWLQPIPHDARQIITDTFLPILKGFDFEKDYYKELWDEISDVLGEEYVHMRLPNAHGNALIMVVIPEFFQEAQAALFRAELRAKGVELS